MLKGRGPRIVLGVLGEGLAWSEKSIQARKEMEGRMLERKAMEKSSSRSNKAAGKGEIWAGMGKSNTLQKG